MSLKVESSAMPKPFETPIASSSSDEDEPVQVKRLSLKKRINLSDDESFKDHDATSAQYVVNNGHPNYPKLSKESTDDEDLKTESITSKSQSKQKRRVFVWSNSEESNNEETPERKSSKQSNTSLSISHVKGQKRWTIMKNDNEETQERTFSRLSDEEEQMNITLQQQRILENLRSDNGYDAESSGDETPSNNRYLSSPRHHSEDEEEKGGTRHGQINSKSKHTKKITRKSAEACRKAMQEDRLKRISESQRMVRESKASLPYHKPKQRSLQEFLKARPQPNPMLRGVKHQIIEVELIGKELEECEKKVEEFYKAVSDEERLTPPPRSPEPSLIPDKNRVLRVLLAVPEGQAKDITQVSGPNQQESQLCETQDSVSLPLDADSQHISNFSDTDIDTHSGVLNTMEENTISDATESQADSSAMHKNLGSETNKITEKIIIQDTPDSQTDYCPEKCTANFSKEKENTVIPDTPDSDTNVLENKILVSDISDFEHRLLESVCDNTTKNESSKIIIQETPDSEMDFCLIEEVSVPKKVKSNSNAISNELQPVKSQKLISTELADACLTPSDAPSDKDIFIKSANKVDESRINGNQASVGDSMNTDDDDFHLVFDDIDDILNNDELLEHTEVKSSPDKQKAAKSFDLEKLYNSGHLVGEDDVGDESNQSKMELKGKAKFLSQLKFKAGPVRLSGGPSEVIELDEAPTAPKGVDELVQRFFRQAKTGVKKPAAKEGILKLIQEGEDIDEDSDLKVKAGAKISLLKSGLKQSMAKLRDEEFRRRQREYQLYENESEGLFGEGDGKVLSDEEVEMETEEVFDQEDAASEAGSTETEPELEDDVVLEDKPIPRSHFMDDEAQESDHEDEDEDPAVEEDEDENEEADEDEQEEESEEELPDIEDSTEKNEDLMTPSNGKRKFQRIKKFDDSDEESESMEAAATKIISEKMTELSDTQPLLDDETDDIIEKDMSFSSECNKSLNLSMLEIGNDSDKREFIIQNSTNSMRVTGSLGFRYPNGLTQLFDETQPVAEVENTPENGFIPIKSALDELGLLTKYTVSQKDDIAVPCSVQFPPEGIAKLVQCSETFPSDLRDLCSGQFPENQAAKKTLSPLKGLIGVTETQTQDLILLCSGNFVTQAQPIDDTPTELAEASSIPVGTESMRLTQKKPRDLNKLINDSPTYLQTNLEDICSGQFVTQNNITNTRIVDDASKAENTIMCAKPLVSVTCAMSTLQAVDMCIVSDDEIEDESVLPAVARKGKRKLAFSDDEEEEEKAIDEFEDPAAEESELEDDFLQEGDGLVEYDSEENEVIVKPQNFFEAEAELSGEEGWGSADEDEAGLDLLEEELGDKETIDEEQLVSQLGKIHARRLLDDDKRDVRLFQEAFLEDGDLHSENGGRQRLFRWRNNDDGTWAVGSRPDISGDEAEEEDEGEVESSWRTARLERETWLMQNKDKISQEADEDSQLLQVGRSLLARMVKPTTSTTSQQGAVSLQPKSPGKAILQALKHKSGSFLARRSISMQRVVALTGTEGEAGCMVSTSSRNFVFTTLSPGSEKGPAQELHDVSIEEDSSPQPKPIKKRPAKCYSSVQQPGTKKKRVESSVFQLLQ